MDSPLIALVLPPLLIVPAMGLLSRVKTTSPLQNELRRKALHLLTGLMALGLPYVLKEPWMVLAASAAVIGWMLAVRLVPALATRFGCVLHGAGRHSFGELYFAFGLTGLLLVTEPGSVLFIVPVLVLTLADTAAAVVGRAWPWLYFGPPDGRKTLSGSLAFAAIAVLVCAATLGAGTDFSMASTFGVAIAIAGLAAITEAVSSKGLDNLTIPLSVWLALYLVTPGV